MLSRGTVILLAALCAVPAFAQQLPDRPTITVEGEASAAIVPDTAVISLGVVTDRLRAADAAADNARAVQAVVEAVKAEGIEPGDIQTTSVGLAPLFEQPASVAKISGFRASNQLQIRVKPVEKAGVLSGKLIDKGVNSIDNVQFVSSNDEKLLDRLRADAVRDAKHKAEVYAEGLGLKLGRVLTIDPNAGGFAHEGFSVQAGVNLKRAAAPVPLEAGQQTARDRVLVTWELVQ